MKRSEAPTPKRRRRGPASPSPSACDDDPTNTRRRQRPAEGEHVDEEAPSPLPPSMTTVPVDHPPPPVVPIRRMARLGLGLVENPADAAQSRSADDRHWQHHELVRPVYHPSPAILRTLLSVLRCVCLRCSHIVVADDPPSVRRRISVSGSPSAERDTLQLRSDLLRMLDDDLLGRALSFVIDMGDVGGDRGVAAAGTVAKSPCFGDDGRPRPPDLSRLFGSDSDDSDDVGGGGGGGAVGARGGEAAANLFDDTDSDDSDDVGDGGLVGDRRGPAAPAHLGALFGDSEEDDDGGGGGGGTPLVRDISVGGKFCRDDEHAVRMTCRRLFRVSLGPPWLGGFDFDGALSRAAGASSSSPGPRSTSTAGDGAADGVGDGGTRMLGRLDTMEAELKDKVVCDHCGARRPTLSLRADGAGLEYGYAGPDDGKGVDGGGDSEIPTSGEGNLSAGIVARVLASVSDGDLEALGMDPAVCPRPESMLVTSLALPSSGGDIPAGTPAAAFASAVRSADSALRRAIDDGEWDRAVLDHLEESLRRSVGDWLLADGSRHLDRAGRLWTGLTNRSRELPPPGGGGRISLPAVSDPNVGIDEVGVPTSLIATITVGEDETANRLRRGGVVVLMSAHGASAAHRVRILPDGGGGALRLHPFCLAAYSEPPPKYNEDISLVGGGGAITGNVDLVVPPSFQAAVEAEQLMLASVGLNSTVAQGGATGPLLSGATGPLLSGKGLVGDSVLAAYQLSRRDVFLDRDEFFDLVTSILGEDAVDGDAVVKGDGSMIIPVPAIVRPRELWSGKQVLNLILPDGVNYTGRTLERYPRRSDGTWHTCSFNCCDHRVTIRNGEVVEGVLDRRAADGIMRDACWLQRIDESVESRAVVRFLERMQSVATAWFLRRSFSVGISDCLLGAQGREEVGRILRQAEMSLENLYDQGHKGQLEYSGDRTMRESLKHFAYQTLHRAGQNAMNCGVSYLDVGTNSLRAMVAAGSGASMKSVSQIVACVGYQCVGTGERQGIKCGFCHRMLPHFRKYDIGLRSRGFVSSSLARGLSPEEFFIHSVAGRDRLVDARQGAHETGSIRRRIIRAMEDMTVQYDGTLRDDQGQLVQFLYGEDGMDASNVRMHSLHSLIMERGQFDRAFLMDASAPSFGHDDLGRPLLRADVLEDCRRDPMALQVVLDAETEALWEDQRTLGAIRASCGETFNYCDIPGNVLGVIQRAIHLFQIDGSTLSDLHPRITIEKVNELHERLVAVADGPPMHREERENSTTLYSILFRSFLASKRVLSEWHLTVDALDWVLDKIEWEYRHSSVSPGEATGILAARSIRLPRLSWQSFRFNIYRAGTVTLFGDTGIPRLKEIIDAVTTIATPTMTIYLEEALSEDVDAANRIRSKVECTTLRDIVTLIEIYYDPDIRHSCVLGDREFIKEYYDFCDESESYLCTLSPWVLRMELDHNVVFDEKIRMVDIESMIRSEYKNDINVVVSDDNSDTLLIRIRVVNGDVPVTGRERSEKTPSNITLPRETELRNLDMSMSDLPYENEKEHSKDRSLSSRVNVGHLLFDEREKKDLGLAHDFDVVLLRQLSKSLLNLKLKGIDGVEKALMYHGVEPWDGNVTTNRRWIFNTKGSNLMAVREVDGIDTKRTTSNDVIEVFGILGIEAARNVMLRELKRIIGFDLLHVNHRHLACLVDIMTIHGHVAAPDQHNIPGLNLLQHSQIDRFESSMEAAVNTDNQILWGVTDNIALGQLASAGTGKIDILIKGQRTRDKITAPLH